MSSQFVNRTVSGDTEQVVCFNGAVRRSTTDQYPEKGVMAEMLMLDHVFENSVPKGFALQMNAEAFLRYAERGLFTQKEIDSAVDLDAMTVTDSLVGWTFTGQRVLIPSVTSFTQALIEAYSDASPEMIAELKAYLPETFQLQIMSDDDCRTQETGVPLIEVPTV